MWDKMSKIIFCKVLLLLFYCKKYAIHSLVFALFLLT